MNDKRTYLHILTFFDIMAWADAQGYYIYLTPDVILMGNETEGYHYYRSVACWHFTTNKRPYEWAEVVWDQASKTFLKTEDWRKFFPELMPEYEELQHALNNNHYTRWKGSY